MNNEESIKRRRDRYTNDIVEHGCGYYSVCWEKACPCSMDAKVRQGFDNEVWERMLQEMREENGE